MLSCFFVLAVSPDAQAKLTCSFERNSHVLAITASQDQFATIDRKHATIVVNRGFFGRRTPVECAGRSPTIRNTDTIHVVLRDQNIFGIDLAGGPFAPGRSPERDRSPEIEISVVVHDRNGALGILGSNRAETFGYGGDHRHPAFNLDAGVRGDQDLDLTSSGRFAQLYYASGGGGGDTVAPEPGSGRVPLGEQADGGAGADRLVGTSRFDGLDGGEGADLLVGRGGRDIISGGLGRDRLFGGKGGDVLFANDFGLDRVNCGPGNDLVYTDRSGSDHFKGCERMIDLSPPRTRDLRLRDPLKFPGLLR